jgi:hypothetical protein
VVVARTRVGEQGNYCGGMQENDCECVFIDFVLKKSLRVNVFILSFKKVRYSSFVFFSPGRLNLTQSRSSWQSTANYIFKKANRNILRFFYLFKRKLGRQQMLSWQWLRKFASGGEESVLTRREGRRESEKEWTGMWSRKKKKYEYTQQEKETETTTNEREKTEFQQKNG